MMCMVAGVDSRPSCEGGRDGVGWMKPERYVLVDWPDLEMRYGRDDGSIVCFEEEEVEVNLSHDELCACKCGRSMWELCH